MERENRSHGNQEKGEEEKEALTLRQEEKPGDAKSVP
jgi:hypothetical protein